MFSPQGSPTLKQHTQTIWYWLVLWNHGILFFFPGVGQPPTRISRVCSQRSQEPQPHGWGVAGWHAAATQNLQCSCTRSWNCQLRCFNLSWNLSDEQWQKVALEKDMRGERYIHEIYLSRAVAQGDRTCERWKKHCRTVHVFMSQLTRFRSCLFAGSPWIRIPYINHRLRLSIY